MYISIAELTENLSFDSIAVRYLVEYGHLKPEEGRKVLEYINEVKLIYSKLPREIQTNNEMPVMPLYKVLEEIQ